MNKVFVTCLCLMIVICVIESSDAKAISKVDDVSAIKCKDLCKLCSCSGYPCGDECICECKNKDDRSEFGVCK